MSLKVRGWKATPTMYEARELAQKLMHDDECSDADIHAAAKMLLEQAAEIDMQRSRQAFYCDKYGKTIGIRRCAECNNEEMAEIARLTALLERQTRELEIVRTNSRTENDQHAECEPVARR